MNAHPHRYAGYRSPIPNAHIARALGDVDDILREAVKADNLRRFREAHPANDRSEQVELAFADAVVPRRASELDLFAGIAFWFLVGIAPALCVLAIMVAK